MSEIATESNSCFVTILPPPSFSTDVNVGSSLTNLGCVVTDLVIVSDVVTESDYASVVGAYA